MFQLAIEVMTPLPDIAPEHKRKFGCRTVGVLVLDEILEGDIRQIHLLIDHLIEFRNIELDRIQLREIPLMRLLIPLEEIRLVNEVARNDVVDILGVLADFTDLIERCDGRAEHVEKDDLKLASAGCLERTDPLERIKRGG